MRSCAPPASRWIRRHGRSWKRASATTFQPCGFILGWLRTTPRRASTPELIPSVMKLSSPPGSTTMPPLRVDISSRTSSRMSYSRMGSPEPRGTTHRIGANSAAEYEAHIAGARAADGHNVVIKNATPVAPALAPKANNKPKPAGYDPSLANEIGKDPNFPLPHIPEWQVSPEFAQSRAERYTEKDIGSIAGVYESQALRMQDINHYFASLMAIGDRGGRAGRPPAPSAHARPRKNQRPSERAERKTEGARR